MDEVLDIESYKNLLLFAQPVKIYGLHLKQFRVRELLTGFNKFNYMRNFVYYINKDSINDEYKREIDDFMFDVKEELMIKYGYVGYDIEYDTFDLVSYHPEYNAMFTMFLSYFTQDRISSAIHIPQLDRINITYNDTKVSPISRKEFYDMMNRFCLLNYANEILEDNDKMEKTQAAIDFDKKKKELENKFGFKEKPTMTFNSILSWLANDGYTHDTLIYKTIFQVMDAFKRKNHMEYCKMINNARSNGLCNMKEAELKKVNNAFCLY